MFNLFNILIITTYLYLSNKIKCDIFSVYSMLISAANDQVWFYLVLWCLTPLLTIFQIYGGGQFYWGEETGVPWEYHRPAASHWQTLSDIVVLLALSGSRTHNISSDSKWPGTIYKFIIKFQHFSLKKIKWQIFFFMKILRKKIPKENCISLKKFQISYWKKWPFANPRRNIENIGNSQIL